jgi:hypothetical protein
MLTNVPRRAPHSAPLVDNRAVDAHELVKTLARIEVLRDAVPTRRSQGRAQIRVCNEAFDSRRQSVEVARFDNQPGGA